ncbi:hypothetical protein ACG7TL_001466 [Trametes sanguinea]
MLYGALAALSVHAECESVDGIPTTNSSGKPVLALLILAYWSDSDEPALLKHEPLTDWIPITDKMANVIYQQGVTTPSSVRDYGPMGWSSTERAIVNAHDDRSSCSGTITIFNPDDPTGTGAPPRTLLVTTAPPISSTVSFPPSTPVAQTFAANATSASASATEASATPTSTRNATLVPRWAGPSIPSSAGHRPRYLGKTLAIVLAVVVFTIVPL